MRISDLKDKHPIVWGLGKEGREAGRLLAQHAIPFAYLDDTENGATEVDGAPVHRGKEAISQILSTCDTIIKSPGVSLYRDELALFRQHGGHITSLLNLCLGEYTARRSSPPPCMIAITGSKGKSTTATLLTRMLTHCGKSTKLVGNIGIPVSAILDETIPPADILVIELSSYQTADIAPDIQFDIALLTALYPDHLNWHNNSETTYYRDKLNLLAHAQSCFAHQQAATLCATSNNKLSLPPDTHLFTLPDKDETSTIKQLSPYLARQHNLANIAGTLAVISHLGLDRIQALEATAGFTGLPHRQQEIGTKDNILYVDDSISTTPQSAIAAIRVYQDAPRPVTLIAGGFDRGIDYQPLATYLKQHPVSGVVCLGASGARINTTLQTNNIHNVSLAETMEQAIEQARQTTPAGGVILLSPAAPSFGLFRDYIARGKAFAKASGFSTSTETDADGDTAA